MNWKPKINLFWMFEGAVSGSHMLVQCAWMVHIDPNINISTQLGGICNNMIMNLHAASFISIRLINWFTYMIIDRWVNYEVIDSGWLLSSYACSHEMDRLMKWSSWPMMAVTLCNSTLQYALTQGIRIHPYTNDDIKAKN